MARGPARCAGNARHCPVRAAPDTAQSPAPPRPCPAARGPGAIADEPRPSAGSVGARPGSVAAVVGSSAGYRAPSGACLPLARRAAPASDRDPDSAQPRGIPPGLAAGAGCWHRTKPPASACRCRPSAAADCAATPGRARWRLPHQRHWLRPWRETATPMVAACCSARPVPQESPGWRDG
ncbi:hypothetical protein D3C71_1661230 [compost metagenome]